MNWCDGHRQLNQKSLQELCLVFDLLTVLDWFTVIGTVNNILFDSDHGIQIVGFEPILLKVDEMKREEQTQFETEMESGGRCSCFCVASFWRL
jgi:hypothetical protein